MNKKLEGVTRPQFSLASLMLVPPALLVIAFAFPATRVVAYFAFPWASEHASNLEWSLVIWGVPEWVVHPFIAVPLYGVDTLVILILLGLSLGFVNNKMTDIVFAGILLTVPICDLCNQLAFHGWEKFSVPLLTTYCRAFSLKFFVVALLAAGYFRLMKRRPIWGTRRRRQFLAAIVIVALAIASYTMSNLIA